MEKLSMAKKWRFFAFWAKWKKKQNPVTVAITGFLARYEGFEPPTLTSENADQAQPFRCNGYSR